MLLALAASTAGAQDCYPELVRVLAGPELEGRGLRGRGAEKTALLLAERFERLGLEPGAPGYLQEVLVPLGVGDGGSWLEIDGRRMPVTVDPLSGPGAFAGTIGSEPGQIDPHRPGGSALSPSQRSAQVVPAGTGIMTKLPS